MKPKTSRDAGFTLLEIMIVVTIVGLLVAIAIPNFVRARSVSLQTTCINNLSQIQSAVAQWATETTAAGNSAVRYSDIQSNQADPDSVWIASCVPIMNS